MICPANVGLNGGMCTPLGWVQSSTSPLGLQPVEYEVTVAGGSCTSMARGAGAARSACLAQPL